MSNKKSIISIAVGSAFAATLGAAPIAFAADNPFAIQSLDKGYMVAAAETAKDGKMKEGKCGEGKCGSMKVKEIKPSDDKAKMKEGKCGEGKCGSAKK